MSEILMSLPLFDQAAVDLKDKGSFSTALDASQLKSIMNSITEGLLGKNDVVDVDVVKMDVQIKNKTGVMDVQIEVRKPLKATIFIKFVLGNDEADKTKIKLVNLEVKQQAGLIAKTALKALNIENKARQSLQDINSALLLALSSQLEPKGVSISDVDLQFDENALIINLLS